MSSSQTLFTLNNSGELEVNKPEARSILEYEVLFKRDKGGAITGDNNGSKKFLACAEIYYIYLVHDVRSPYYNLSLIEKKKKAREDAKLPDRWKEDKELDAAVARYKEDFKLSSAGKAFVVAERAYHTMGTDTEDLQDGVIVLKETLKNIMRKVSAKGPAQLGEIELINATSEANAVILEISKTQKAIIDNIKQFASLGDTVKVLAAKFAEEGGSMRTPVGGGQLGNREE
jgi:hypothetical protein